MQGENIKRNFVWNTVGSLTYFAAQWLFTILVWRMTAQSVAVTNAGLLNTATTFTNMFLSLASYGMYSFQVSDMRNMYAQSTYVKSRSVTCVASSVLCCLTLAASSFLGEPYSAVQIACIILMLGFRMIESKTDIYNGIYQKNGRLDVVGKTYALRGIISIVVFVFVLYLTASMTITLGVMVLANAVFYFIYTKRKITPFYTKEKTTAKIVAKLLIECAPLAIYSFLNTTTSSVPKILLERIMGSDALGIYASVTAPVMLLQVGATYLFTPFITSFAERFAKRDTKGFVKSVSSVFLIIAAMLPLGLIVSYTIGEWGLATFVSKELSIYSYLLPPMVFSAVLTALVLFFSMVLTVMRYMRGLIFANVCGIVVSCIVSTPYINAFDMQGTTYAMITALSMQAICLAIIIVIRGIKHFKR